jgi:N-ethylmaleimide reductase
VSKAIACFITSAMIRLMLIKRGMAPPMKLTSAYTFNNLSLTNRIVMAPMTRARADDKTFCATPMMQQYYEQRATAGLIISEGILVHPTGCGYALTPGLYNAHQVASWQPVTAAVKARGCHIFAQIWHCGRVSHPSVNGGHQPLSSTDQCGLNTPFAYDDKGHLGMQTAPAPRALSSAEIKQVIAYYVQAAENAIAAGFEGIEVHGANGYLPEQFLHGRTNDRSDQYGGSPENRCRFVVELMTAICAKIGARKTALRLSPFLNIDHPIEDPDLGQTTLLLLKALNPLKLAYIHFSERVGRQANVTDDYRLQVREVWDQDIMVAGGLTLEQAETLLQQGLIDLAAFGKPFIANPDFVARIEWGYALADADPSRYYAGGEQGYIDYPNAEI